MKTLFKHFNSSRKLKEKISVGHPWAAKPSTIGSLATVYLTMLVIDIGKPAVTNFPNLSALRPGGG